MANPNPNQDNLVTQATRSPEERRRIASMGGVAAQKANKRRRTLKAIAQALADKKIQVTNPDGSSEQTTLDVALVLAQYNKAVEEQDTAAAKFIAGILGEDILRVETDTPLLVVSDALAKEMQKED